jgi:hypothetical protein
MLSRSRQHSERGLSSRGLTSRGVGETRALETWDKSRCTELQGGITNKLKRVRLPSGVAVLVRVFGAEGMIDRNIENPTFEAIVANLGRPVMSPLRLPTPPPRTVWSSTVTVWSSTPCGYPLRDTAVLTVRFFTLWQCGPPPRDSAVLHRDSAVFPVTMWFSTP